MEVPSKPWDARAYAQRFTSERCPLVAKLNGNAAYLYKEFALGGARHAGDDAEGYLVGEALDAADAIHSALNPEGYASWQAGVPPTSSEEIKKTDYDWQRRASQIWQHKTFSSTATCDKWACKAATVDYLTKPWLSSPWVDWCLIDALVHHEMVSFKRETDPRGPSSTPLPSISTKIWRWAKLNGLMYVLPIWWLESLYHDDSSYAAPLAGIYLAAILLFNVAYGRYKRDGRKTRATLINALERGYDALNGAALSPTWVREELVAAAKQGVIWDQVVFALLDARIARDPAVWITHPL